MRYALLLLLFSVCLAAIPGSSDAAGIPNLINYQGRLTDDLGAPLDTVVDIEFVIAKDSLGVDVVWSEPHPNVEIVDGLFSVMLGSIEPMDPSMFDGVMWWMGMVLRGGPMTTPLLPVTTTAYSFKSLYCDTTSFSHKIANNSVTSAKIQDNSIQPVDMASEPGIAVGDSMFSIGLTTTYKKITGSTIDAPSAGYLVAIATFNADIYSGSPASESQQITFGISPDSTSLANESITYWDVPAGVSAGQYWRQPMVTQLIMDIPASGSYSLYLLARESKDEPQTSVFYSRLTLMFFPTAYGDVATDSFP